MHQILYINACVREKSRTHILAQEVLRYLDGTVEPLDLQTIELLPLNREQLGHRDRQLEAGNFDSPSFALARQLAQADTIVIAAPYWDLMFPALLKMYLEQITVCGVTFRYDEHGVPQGLCRAKQVYYITTAGGVIGSLNLGFDYVRTLFCGLFGIPEVTCFSAEQLDIDGVDAEKQLLDAKQSVQRFFDCH